MENWRGVFGRTVSELERGTKRRKDCVCLGIACTCRGTVCGEVVRCGRNLDDGLGRRCKWTLQREITEHGILCVNLFPQRTGIPSSHLKHCWSGSEALHTRFWESSEPPEGHKMALLSTYIEEFWIPHSSTETWMWGAKLAASCSASLEAWDKETRNTHFHSTQHRRETWRPSTWGTITKTNQVKSVFLRCRKALLSSSFSLPAIFSLVRPAACLCSNRNLEHCEC